MLASTPSAPFTERDLARLAARGISVEEAQRQLALLRRPPPAVVLDRPCVPGDGIDRLDATELARLAAVHDAAAAAGDVGGFVPASGAATRMFKDLLAYTGDPRALVRSQIEADAAEGRAEATTLLAFADGLPRFAFRDALDRLLRERGQFPLDDLRPNGSWGPVLEALLDARGLDYASLPKGLVLFHSGPGGPRTAFEEHLAEGAALYRASDGTVRFHFTASPEHLAKFRETRIAFDRERPTDGTRFEVRFSVQDPATDTLAMDSAGAPFRDAGGALVFRPAGHGALLANLADSATPLVMVKNIDNVAAAAWRAPTLEWVRVVVGRAIEVRDAAHALVRRLDAADAAAVDDARRFAHALGFDADVAAGAAPNRDALRALLDRPVRVCGMVLNTGEPGGGPFWVRGRDGRVTRQIVESAQVNLHDPAQRAVFRAATHFNPVFIACALDDAAGRRHDLQRFVDPEAVIVTHRSAGGRDLVALERPGLWNGGMAHWNTVFVEVPLAVFNPVKTVLDLLRPEHQPA